MRFVGELETFLRTWNLSMESSMNKKTAILKEEKRSLWLNE